MATCSECDREFDPAEAAAEYNAEFGGDLDYDEDYEGELCASCASSQTSSNINRGRAIDMMNGEEDHDDDFVQKYL